MSEDLISRLPPIGLYNFQLHLPFQDLTKEDCLHDDSTNNERKRSRDWNLDTAWQKKFELQWPNLINQIQPTDWQKLYWESHVQKCLDEATEKALVTSFKGRIGDIQVSDGRAILVLWDLQFSHIVNIQNFLTIAYNLAAM